MGVEQKAEQIRNTIAAAKLEAIRHLYQSGGSLHKFLLRLEITGVEKVIGSGVEWIRKERGRNQERQRQLQEKKQQILTSLEQLRTQGIEVSSPQPGPYNLHPLDKAILPTWAAEAMKEISSSFEMIDQWVVTEKLEKKTHQKTGNLHLAFTIEKSWFHISPKFEDQPDEVTNNKTIKLAETIALVARKREERL